MTEFTKVVLFTDTDGKAKFKEETIAMAEGNPQSQLTEIFSAEGYQLRYSPVGFRSQFHVTGKPSGCLSCRVKWKLVCRMAARVFSRLASTSIQQTRCPKVQALIPQCTATGAVRWAMSL